jgi:putative hydrolase of the HAD superfamily
MPKQSFAHVTSWVFDLDNTLYGRDAGIFKQIERRMTAFVARELAIDETAAAALRHKYWRAYGTTLAGMMAMHGTDPDPYLVEVHDIDLSSIAPDQALADAINSLPGQKIVFTNGSRQHGLNICTARGLNGCFDAIYGIEDADYLPKPAALAYAKIFESARLDATTSAMFEDDAVNLIVPHSLGMRTILVGPKETADHIHHHTDDLTDFLTQLA